MGNNISDRAKKGATTVSLIGARFGPQSIVIGAAVGEIIGFILDGYFNKKCRLTLLVSQFFQNEYVGRLGG